MNKLYTSVWREELRSYLLSFNTLEKQPQITRQVENLSNEGE